MNDNSTFDVNENQAESVAMTTAGLESTFNNSFFCTNDKFLASLDASDVIALLVKEYPQMSLENSDSQIKKSIMQFLQNENFVIKVLKYYNITIFELFKVLYKSYSSIFKGPFLKKIRLELALHEYSKQEFNRQFFAGRSNPC